MVDHFFEDARKGGWFAAVLSEAPSHPRAIRTMEYADHYDEIWQSQVPDPYPSFESGVADEYVEAGGVVRNGWQNR